MGAGARAPVGRRGRRLIGAGILRELGLIVLAGAVFVLLARRVGIPSILAYMLAGLALGPVTGMVTGTETVDLISETGIALLLFLVGLELSLDQIRGVGRTALLAGIGQVVLTAAAAFLVTRAFGFAPAQAALLALGITFSSTVVVVKLLHHRGELARTHGRIAVGILLVQDIVVVLVLTVLAGLGRGADADAGDIARGLLSAFAGVAVLAAAAFALARWVLPPLFGWLSSSLESLFIWSLSWCFAFILAAEALHLSVELGAFLAGVSLAQLPYYDELHRRVTPLVDFFIAVFFVTLGLHMQLDAALGLIGPVVALTLLVLIGKPLILMALLGRLGTGERTSFLASLSLGQISEFSFIVAALGMSAGLLDDAALSLVGAVGLLTIGASSFLITHAPRLYESLSRRGLLAWFGAPAYGDPDEVERPTGHVIVVGMNSLGRRLVDAFAERGETVVAIDTDRRKLADLRARTVHGSIDDPTVPEEANLAGAKLVVSALQIEDANGLLAYRARRAGVPVSIHAFDTSVIDDLVQLGVDHLMVSKHDGIRQVAGELRRAGVLG